MNQNHNLDLEDPDRGLEIREEVRDRLMKCLMQSSKERERHMASDKAKQICLSIMKQIDIFKRNVFARGPEIQNFLQVLRNTVVDLYRYLGGAKG